MTDLKAIIFDLGKVIFDLSFDRVFQSWAISSGRHFNEIKSKFVFDEIFDKFEKNEISPSQFRTAVSQRLELNLSDEDFDRGWCELYLDVYKDIDKLLFKLKRNYKLIALTNTNSIHQRVWSAKYADTLRIFDKVFSSHELATRKPERRIFEIVIEYLKLTPTQTLFLDDNLNNIIGAKEFGMFTILVTSNEQMKHELEKFAIIE